MSLVVTNDDKEANMLPRKVWTAPGKNKKLMPKLYRLIMPSHTDLCSYCYAHSHLHLCLIKINEVNETVSVCLLHSSLDVLFE